MVFNMEKKFILLVSSIFLIFSFFVFRVINLTYSHHEEYVKKYTSLTDIYVEGGSAPRGRILDVNGNILVDNTGMNNIIYHKTNASSLKEELKVAEELVKLTNYSYAFKESKLKEFYMLKYPEEVNKLITEEERKKYSERKLTKKEIES